MKSNGIFSLLLLSVFLTSHAAQAYIPPSEYIVKKLTDKRGRYRLLRLKSNVIGMNGEKPTGAHFKTVSLFEPKKRILQTWAVDDAGGVLYFSQRQLTETASIRKLGDQRLAHLIDSLLFEWDGSTLARAVKSHGVPVLTEEELAELPDEPTRRASEKTRLARQDISVAWVIGTSDTPQLWVEKDGFLPIRYVAPDWSSGVAVTMENHRYTRDLPFPRVIRLVRADSDKETLIREELTEVLTNPEDKLGFPRVSEGFTSRGNSADSSIRDLIEKYFSTLR